jgi:hypothetical protein
MPPTNSFQPLGQPSTTKKPASHSHSSTSKPTKCYYSNSHSRISTSSTTICIYLILSLRINSMPLCLVSPYKNPVLSYQKEYPFVYLTKQDSSLLFFDKGAMMSTSDIHLVQVKVTDELLNSLVNNTLHIRIFDPKLNIKSFSIKTSVYIKNSTSEYECVNNCQSYFISSADHNKQCRNGSCICNYKQFGEYC